MSTPNVMRGAQHRAAARSGPPRHLSNIQVLRGIAAVMVLLYHMGNELNNRGFDNAPELWVGSAGVDIFFVISGFIMVHSAASAFGKAGAPGLFLARRIVRLVPLYWLMTTIFVVAEVWDEGRAGLSRQTIRWFAASYAFLFYPHGPDGDFPIYVQGWTLNYEMFFYLCFTIALMVRRPIALAGLSFGLVTLAAVGLSIVLPWPIDRWADTNILEFVLGLGLALVYARGVSLSLPAAAILGAAGFAVFCLTIASVDAWLPYRGLVWGPPALAVVAAAALHRPSKASSVRIALEALGDVSYALYLIHYAFFIALGDALQPFVTITSMPQSLYGGLCFVGAILAAFVTHYAIERPVTRSLNRIFALPRRWSALTSGEPTI